MKLYEKLLVGAAGAAGAGTVAWRTMFPWIGYDLQLISAGMRMNKVRMDAMSSMMIDKFEKHVANQPKKPFIIFEDCVYSYEFVDQMACKIANVVKAWGVKPRDTVAIMIQNEPAFIWTFLGLQKLGVAAAFINYNLKMNPLVHSIKAANCKFLIVGEGQSLLENVLDVRSELAGIDIYVQGLGNKLPPQGVHSFDPLMHTALASAIDPKFREVINLEDICCYIYTSGTTGNPKPAIINHLKSLGIGVGLAVVDLQPHDILYVPLPLYHSAGGGLGLFSVLRTGNPKPCIINHLKACVNCCIAECVHLQPSDIFYFVMPLYHSAAGATGLFGVFEQGSTILLKRKFSASQFWPDCCKYDVTVIQYIGELFRYLLAQPVRKCDSEHKVRAAFGNGLRKDIWTDVEKRFKIPFIAEFFGATEGVSLMLNIAKKPGAIGRLSPFMNSMDPDPKALVKFDYGTAQPIRDKEGRCIKVPVGEPGLFISKVPDILIKNGTFTPYMSSKEANEKKLIRNAFADGDIYFNYGDVFILDKDYFIYFKDRIGDTFRWKGENVSTTELANVITSLSFVEDANVYGVSIPGHDGRAGMVALTLNNGCSLGEKELKELFDHVKESLPEYAHPLFVRHLDQAIITGTFKQRKVELVQEAYDVDKVKDCLYYRDTAKKTYSKLMKADLPKFLSSKL